MYYLNQRISSMACASVLGAVLRAPRAHRRGRPGYLRGVSAACLCLKHAAPHLHIASGSSVWVLFVHLSQTAHPGNTRQLHALPERCPPRMREHKIFRLVALLVSSFGTCWLPIHVFNVLRYVDISLVDKHHF
ncbi:prolactin-releasing peptide receptor-like [Tachysurus ichikawai]